MYSKQNSYAPSTDTLSVDIKDMIEQKFPRLNQDIIDDAVAYARYQYTEYLLTEASKVASDQEAENFFVKAVMEHIHKHNRRQHDTLIAFMLAHQRHNTQNPLTVNQALNPSFSSDLLTLPFPPGQLQKMVEPILEENRNKLIPQHLHYTFPAYWKYPIRNVPSFLSSDSDRINKFWTLSYKLQRQIIAIEQLTQGDSWTWDAFTTTWSPWRPDLKIKMFDEIYRLAQLNLNANVLERLILDSVMRILDESSVFEQLRINFIHFFENTINNQENRRYCRIYQENCKRLLTLRRGY